jgi:hypothetical protein
MNRLSKVIGFRTAPVAGRGAAPPARLVVGWVAAIALGVLAAGVGGCDRGPDPQTASPRAAAKAFAEAMTTGDAATIRRVSDGDDASLQVLTAVANGTAAYTRLERAAATRFGDPKAVISILRRSDPYAKLLAGIDAAPEAVQGDQATVGSGSEKLHLKRSGDAWKVDRAMQLPPGGGDVSGHLAMMRAMTQAYDEVTAGMASGAYGTADAAKAALVGKTMQAVLAQQPPRVAGGAATMPATTGPTTRQAITLPAATRGAG